jgi:hypothetical protein
LELAAARGCEPAQTALATLVGTINNDEDSARETLPRDEEAEAVKSEAEAGRVVVAQEGVRELDEASTGDKRMKKGKSDHEKCSFCGKREQKPDSKLKACGGCGEVRYCSQECQTSHWKKGHKLSCHDEMGFSYAQVEEYTSISKNRNTDLF